jgi:hypothetical protein
MHGPVLSVFRGSCPSLRILSFRALLGLRLGPEATHFVLRGGADVQRIDRSGAGRNATKDDPFWLRCRGRRMHEDRRICGARFGYSVASRQELEDGGESASPFKTYCGRPP